MNRKKEREFNGVWNVERLLSNYLLFADKDGCITIPEQGEATPYVIRQRRFLAALNQSGILLDYFLVYFCVIIYTKDSCRELCERNNSKCYHACHAVTTQPLHKECPRFLNGTTTRYSIRHTSKL